MNNEFLNGLSRICDKIRIWLGTSPNKLLYIKQDFKPKADQQNKNRQTKGNKGKEKGERKLGRSD